MLAGRQSGAGPCPLVAQPARLPAAPQLPPHSRRAARRPRPGRLLPHLPDPDPPAPAAHGLPPARLIGGFSAPLLDEGPPAVASTDGRGQFRVIV